MQIAIRNPLVILKKRGVICSPYKMTKSFLIAVCIIIAIALIVFPIVVSYKEQKNDKK